MSAVSKQPKGTQGGWTPVKCLEQSRKLRDQKIWLKSTGPRTAGGKIKSSMNACKPGYAERQAEKIEMNYIGAYLRLQKMFTDILRFQTNHAESLCSDDYTQLDTHLDFLENELGNLEHLMFDGLSFYEISGSHSRNVILFSSGCSP